MKAPRRRWLRRLAIAYLALLAASHVARWFQPEPPMPARTPSVEVYAWDGDRRTERPIRMAYWDLGPLKAPEEASPPVVLLHGSPGAKENFDGIAPGLRDRRRVIVPDLPGFGASERDLPDYSIRAHGHETLELLDRLGVTSVHVVGYSMGGGVALHLAELAPERVASLTLLASIGEQRMELLGDYHLNHGIHGLQLAALWLLREGTPHFGALDRTLLGVGYARNFFDTDQRPLSGILADYEGPALVYHGRRDILVPFAAAVESARLLPQAEQLFVDRDHFFVFTEGPAIAANLEAFFDAVEAGEAATRATADPERLVRAQAPFDPSGVPPVSGFSRLVLLVLLALATFVSEDLTCITAGLLASSGRLELLPAILACFAGIYLSDLLLYAAGRFLGRPALARPPMSWLVRPEDLAASSRWFDRYGPAAILLSRFVPGTRLPTYTAAGLFRTQFWRFSFYFLLGAAIWTPILVSLSWWLGVRMRAYLEVFKAYAWVGALAVVIAVLLVVRVGLPALTWRGRRLLRGAWRRRRRWEYWPPWVIYPPVVLWVLALGLRHRHFTLFTAANPAIPDGGFVGESKSAILEGLCAGEEGRARVAPYRLLPAALPPQERWAEVAAFAEVHGYPLALKPDAGERGHRVAIVRDPAEAEAYLEGAAVDTLVQRFVPSKELGVFYLRRPGEDQGRIFSVTAKELPEVVGDGRRTLETLILKDDRLLPMAQAYLRENAASLDEVPEAGERRRILDIGSHSRGSFFSEAPEYATPELLAALDRLSHGYPGFFFGRYDLRGPEEELARGEGFSILELNGVTAEATHIYDRRVSLWKAYRVLFEQWRLAFEIGGANTAQGANPTPLGTLLRRVLQARRERKKRVAPEEASP